MKPKSELEECIDSVVDKSQVQSSERFSDCSIFKKFHTRPKQMPAKISIPVPKVSLEHMSQMIEKMSQQVAKTQEAVLDTHSYSGS